MESLSTFGAYRKTKPMLHLFINLPLLATKKNEPITIKKRIKRDLALLKYTDSRIKEVIEMVVDGTVITFSDIIGTSRVSEIVKLRFVCIHLILENYNIQLKVVAKNLNRDHSTIIHARDTVQNQLRYDAMYRDFMKKYENIFSERFTSDFAHKNKNNLTGNQ